MVGVAANKVRTRGVRADNTTEMTATIGMITVLIEEIKLNVSGGTRLGTYSDRQLPAITIAVGVNPKGILGLRAKTVFAVTSVSLADVPEGRVVRRVDDLDVAVTGGAATGVVAGIVAWVGRRNGRSTSLQCA